MDYKEAIEILQTLYPLRCRMVDGRLQGGFRDYNCDTGKAITFAISAMQELQMYKAGKLVLIPDATHKKQCEELDEYKKLGTLEEIRDAVDAQYTNVGKWIPAYNPPETDETEMSDYLLLSFENFPVPLVGRYELDEEGNAAYYAGDSEDSCISQGLFVNAWMPLPEPYKGEKDE